MSKHKPRILVVDDNLEMARGVGEGLVDAGYDALAVGSGDEALRRLEAEDFDGVVTDLRMAGHDGLAVLEASRQRAPDRPVIVMTAYSAIDSAIESIRRGAYHYLTKPFKQEELAIFLGRALDSVRVRREGLGAEVGAEVEVGGRQHHRPQRGPWGRCGIASSVWPMRPRPSSSRARRAPERGVVAKALQRRQPARRRGPSYR